MITLPSEANEFYQKSVLQLIMVSIDPDNYSIFFCKLTSSSKILEVS